MNTVTRLPWQRIWITAIVIAVVGVSINESLLRIAGHRTSLVSDEDLWSLARSQVEKISSNGILLLGASRMQTNIDLDYLRSNCKN